MELPLSEPTTLAVMQIYWLLDHSYTGNEIRQKDVTFLLAWVRLRVHYWQFLDDPARCGVLYNERAKCYTRIVCSLLLFLEAPPDPEGPDYLYREECRQIVLASWGRMLYKCVPGDEDLICRLRDFTLDRACKGDVERVIAWLEVGLQDYWFVGYIDLLGVFQMDSNIPRDVLVRWKIYGFQRFSLLSYEAAPVQMVGTYVLGGVKAAAMSVFSLVPEPIRDRLFE